LEKIAFTINGAQHSLEVPPNETLTTTLRERLRLTGTKLGCDSGTCGSCAVLIDNRLRNSCVTLTALLDGSGIITIEGLVREEKLHPVQKAFLENGAIQCGYCTPGMVIAAVALLEETPRPSEKDIRKALAGNICRCTGYTKILKAISEAAGV
jgi:aerobic-type carbon monoxide dehydrogenase small subunit (CoxS/CutS family)